MFGTAYLVLRHKKGRHSIRFSVIVTYPELSLPSLLNYIFIVTSTNSQSFKKSKIVYKKEETYAK